MLGGVEWGSATDGRRAYVALSDQTVRPASGDSIVLGRTMLDPTVGGGLFALNVADGKAVWSAPPPVCGGRPRCSPAQSAAITAIPGAVFSGSVDGHVRAYSTDDGRVLWDFDTRREFDTVNKWKASGGSIDAGGPAVRPGTRRALPARFRQRTRAAGTTVPCGQPEPPVWTTRRPLSRRGSVRPVTATTTT